MGSKGHFYVSIVKSILRIIGCGFLFTSNLIMAAVLLGVAQILGILQQVVDKR